MRLGFDAVKVVVKMVEGCGCGGGREGCSTAMFHCSALVEHCKDKGNVYQFL